MKAILKKFCYSNLLLIFFACDEKEPEMPVVVEDEKPKEVVVKREPNYHQPEVVYEIDSLETNESIHEVLDQFTEEEQKMILAINRVDRERVRAHTRLVIPDCPSGDVMDFTPLPMHVSTFQCVPKLALISRRLQAFGLYEHGDLIHWGPVSTGKRSTKTPKGLHYATYKSKLKHSSVNHAWKLPFYVNFMNFEGVGTHQYVLPGNPASHGCVRTLMHDAEFIFNWADMWQLEGNEVAVHGTPFIVFGDYDYDSGKPWFDVQKLYEHHYIKDEEYAELDEYFDQYMRDKKNFPEETRVELSSL